MIKRTIKIHQHYKVHALEINLMTVVHATSITWLGWNEQLDSKIIGDYYTISTLG